MALGGALCLFNDFNEKQFDDEDLETAIREIVEAVIGEFTAEGGILYVDVDHALERVTVLLDVAADDFDIVYATKELLRAVMYVLLAKCYLYDVVVNIITYYDECTATARFDFLNEETDERDF